MKITEILTNESILGESSLSRVHQHTLDRNIGLISASRGERTQVENQALHSQLGQQIRAAGFGMINVRGRYIENYGTENAVPVDERAYLVVGMPGDDSGNLLGLLKKWGTEYGQDSIIHKPFDSPDAILYGTKQGGYPGAGNAIPAGTWHPNRAAEFLTILKKKSSGDHSFAVVESVVFLSDKSFFAREEVEF